MEWEREGTKTRRRKWGWIGRDEEEGWRVTGGRRDETGGHEDRRDQGWRCEGDGHLEGDNASGVGELKREGVRVWRGVRASEPGRGAVRQSGKPPGKQGRQTG